MNLFKKIAIIHRAEKAVKRVKALAKENEQLSIDLQKAILNLNADIEVLMGLLPSCKSALIDLRVLINDSMAD